MALHYMYNTYPIYIYRYHQYLPYIYIQVPPILTLYIYTGTTNGGLHFDCTVQSSELGNEKFLKVGDFKFIVPSGESSITVAFTE